MLEPGSLVAGKLRVERVLGQGGMGVVAARDARRARPAGRDQGPRPASSRTHPEIVQRFVREARAVVRSRASTSAASSTSAQLDDGAPYIVMELLEGADLGAADRARRRSPPEIAADYVLQACEAIAEAHALGIVHRDLKPANLFVTRRLDGEPLVKVLDFGISKAPSARRRQDHARRRP